MKEENFAIKLPVVVKSFNSLPKRAKRTMEEWDSLEDEEQLARCEGVLYCVRVFAHSLSRATPQEVKEAETATKETREWISEQDHTLFLHDGSEVLAPLEEWFRPEYVKCVRKDKSTGTTWCGVNSVVEWTFSDVNHAFLHRMQAGRLLVCSKCAKVISEYLTECTEERDCGLKRKDG